MASRGAGRIAVVAALVVAASSGTVVAASAQESSPYDGCGLLLEGQTNACVTRLQQDLNDVNTKYRLPVTGFFGPKTRIAVLDFQGRNGLPADGNVGQQTQDELFEQADNNGSVPSPTSAGPKVQAEEAEPAPSPGSGSSSSSEPSDAEVEARKFEEDRQECEADPKMYFRVFEYQDGTKGGECTMKKENLPDTLEECLQKKFGKKMPSQIRDVIKSKDPRKIAKKLGTKNVLGVVQCQVTSADAAY